MPSIPQSLLWISLVVLWLFVLVPMLISKRDAVRRTSDVALATRVLNSGRSARLLRRRAPAAGQPATRTGGRPKRISTTISTTRPSTNRQGDRSWWPPPTSTKVAEPEYLDVDVIDEDSAALPVGASASAAVEVPEPEQGDQTDELPLEFDEHADEEPSPMNRTPSTNRNPRAPTTSTSTSPIRQGWRRRRTPSCNWPTP